MLERQEYVSPTFEAWDARRASLHADYDIYHDNPTHDEAMFIVVCGKLGLLFKHNPGFVQQYTDSLYPTG